MRLTRHKTNWHVAVGLLGLLLVNGCVQPAKDVSASNNVALLDSDQGGIHFLPCLYLASGANYVPDWEYSRSDDTDSWIRFYNTDMQLVAVVRREHFKPIHFGERIVGTDFTYGMTKSQVRL